MRVVTGSNDGTARVWNVESGKTVLAIETGLDIMDAAIYSPDMTMIGTCGQSADLEFIKIWDAKKGKLITNLKGHIRINTSTVRDYTKTVYSVAHLIERQCLMHYLYKDSIL